MLVAPGSIRGAEHGVMTRVTAEVRRAAQALPADVAVALELTGPGGGAWTVAKNGGRVEVREGRAPLVDSALRCTVSCFWDLLDGRLDPSRAFLAGEVELEGDVGLLLRLQAAS